MCGPWLPVAIPCGTGRLRCPTAVATHTGDFWKGNKCLSPSPSPAELLLTSCRAQLTASFHPRSISPFISGSGKRSSCRLQDCTPTAQGWLTGRLNARNQEHEVPPSPTPGPPHAHPAAPSPALGQADSAIPGRGLKTDLRKATSVKDKDAMFLSSSCRCHGAHHPISPLPSQITHGRQRVAQPHPLHTAPLPPAPDSHRVCLCEPFHMAPIHHCSAPVPLHGQGRGRAALARRKSSIP